MQKYKIKYNIKFDQKVKHFVNLFFTFIADSRVRNFHQKILVFILKIDQKFILLRIIHTIDTPLEQNKFLKLFVTCKRHCSVGDEICASRLRRLTVLGKQFRTISHRQDNHITPLLNTHQFQNEALNQFSHNSFKNKNELVNNLAI